MFWVQAALSFVLWIAVGIFLTRRAAKLRKATFAIPRASRGLRAGLLFAASPVGIFVPLLLASNQGGMRQDSLLPWAWALITLGGLACVGCATQGLTYAVSLAVEAAAQSRVTPGTPPASSNSEAPDR